MPRNFAIFLRWVLALISSMAFAIEPAIYRSENFSTMSDTLAHFIIEKLPVSTRSANTANVSTIQKPATSIPCVATAIRSVGRHARRRVGYASAQRSKIHTLGKSRHTRHPTQPPKAKRRQVTRTASLPGSRAQTRSVSRKTLWSTHTIGTARSRAVSTAKTVTPEHDTENVRHPSAAVVHPTAIIGIAVPARPKVLTPYEMERVTAGTVSAAAEDQVAAQALGRGAAASQTAASASTLATSSSSPVPGPAFGLLSSNYSNSQAAASAIGGQFADINGSSHISVAANGGGAQIDARGAASAAGGDRSQAQVSLQFYGLSIGHVDLAFGTTVTTACCAPQLAAQVTANGVAGGPYSQEVRAFPLSTIRGQVQSRADIAVVSSSLPLLDAGQMMSLGPRAFPPP